MPLNPTANNYNPLSGFDPRTALSDVRNQIMSYMGNNQGGGGAPFGSTPAPRDMFQNRPPSGEPRLGIGDTMMPNDPLQSLFGNFSPAFGGGTGGFGSRGTEWQIQNPIYQQASFQRNPFIQAMQNAPTGAAPNTAGGMNGYQTNQDPLALMQGFSSAQGGGIGGGAGQFGLPVGQGAPGGNALDWLSGLGMPVPPFLSNIANNRPASGGDYNTALQQLGGVGGLPSLQTLMSLSPSEQEFLAGFFETVLGIPFQDIVDAAARPFAGLGAARGARTSFR